MILGHQTIQKRLRDAYETSVYAQSLLFMGPESTGKFVVALDYADTLLGDSAATHVDCMILEPPIETVKQIQKVRDISIEIIQNAIHFLSSSPFQSKHKVLVVRDAHRMTEAAQNALLKTLEEPPDYAIIILITHKVRAILPTLISRCQQFLFSFVPCQEIENYIEKSAIATASTANPEQIGFLVTLGRPGVVMQFLADTKRFSQKLIRAEDIMKSTELPLWRRLDISEMCSKNPQETNEILSWWLGSLHEDNEKNFSYHTIELMDRIEVTRQKLEIHPSSARLILDTFFLNI